jgi:hypothetical protein
MLIPVLRICVMFFWCVLFPADLTQAKCMLVMAPKQLTCGLVDKCNKDQLKQYPPKDGLIKEAETCRGELIKVVA